MKRKSILGIITFYVIAIGLRYLTNRTDLISNISNDFLKIIITAIGPAIGALIAIKLFDLKFSMSLKGNYKKLLIPFLIFWVTPLVLITAKAYFYNGNFVITTVFAILVYGLLEEIGWRGFLYEQLKPLTQFANILIVTILWFIWHLNFELSLSNLIFFLILLLGSWGIRLVADKTKSLLVIASFHSLNNFYSEWNTLNLLIIGTFALIWILAIIYRTKMELKNGS